MVTDPAGNATYEPRSPEEMEKLATLARSAIGYDEVRGDKVEIVNMQFARPDDLGTGDNALLGPLGLDKSDLFRNAAIALLGTGRLLAQPLVVWPLMARLAETPAQSHAGDQQLLSAHHTKPPA